MIIAVPAEVAILPASSLVLMPPREISDAAAPAMASISGVIFSTMAKCFACGIKMRRGGVKPVNVGQENEQVRAHHGGDAGGEPVIVAIADFAGGDRVVLVDDRNRS